MLSTVAQYLGQCPAADCISRLVFVQRGTLVGFPYDVLFLAHLVPNVPC